MLDNADKNEPKFDLAELAKDLLYQAGSASARSVKLREKDGDYRGSMRESITSIGFSTRLICLLFGMDDERLLSRPWWLSEVANDAPLQPVDGRDMKQLTRIARELFHVANKALDEWSEQFT